MDSTDGLIYYPSRYDPPLGHPGFEVWLRQTPSPRYFDARRALFPVETGGVLKRQNVEATWSGGPVLRFVVGRIRLEAHDGDFEEIFGFGGEAAISAEAGATVCRVTSSAPFLPLSDDPGSPFAIMVSELEVIIAQSRARWGNTEYTHLDRLSHADPMTVFVAVVGALEVRLGHLAHSEDDPTLRLAVRLAREMRELLSHTGEWPAVVPSLDDIL